MWLSVDSLTERIKIMTDLEFNTKIAQLRLDFAKIGETLTALQVRNEAHAARIANVINSFDNEED